MNEHMQWAVEIIRSSPSVYSIRRLVDVILSRKRAIGRDKILIKNIDDAIDMFKCRVQQSLS